MSRVYAAMKEKKEMAELQERLAEAQRVVPNAIRVASNVNELTQLSYWEYIYNRRQMSKIVC